MKPLFTALQLLVLVASLMALGACEAPHSNIELHAAQAVGALGAPALKEAEPAAGGEAVEKKRHRYSPFVLSVQSGRSLFKKISFKDVGLGGVREELREEVYERMASSLATELAVETSLSMPASVIYDEAITDPANHLACGSEHLYVDVWQSEEPKRWGYSLWSGCGEEDNFAWQEVSFTPHPEGDFDADIEPLAKSIVASIREASQRGCYQKTC